VVLQVEFDEIGNASASQKQYDLSIIYDLKDY